MTQEWTVPAWLAIVGAAALALLVLLALVATVSSSRAGRRLGVESERLQVRLAELEHRLDATTAVAESAPPRESREFVITRLGDEPAAPAPVLPPAVFADIVLREAVVTSASLVHGLRRALAPEVRNRIRFEVRREVRRARKARRAERREALRAWQSTHRSHGVEDAA